MEVEVLVVAEAVVEAADTAEAVMVADTDNFLEKIFPQNLHSHKTVFNF
jgi:hypothetical protein